MNRNMTQWARDLISTPVKKALPILSFPSVQLLNVSVKELIGDSSLQATGMHAIATQLDTAASVSLMDLSVEAECFGSRIVYSDNEVPTVEGCIVNNAHEANALQIPEPGSGRTQMGIDAVNKALSLITDRPVFAGTIGPFSLAGRLMDVTKIMMLCYEEPDVVHTVVRKAAHFLRQYINAYKQTGAHGVIIAEPLAGLLSPDFGQEFSSLYIRELVESLQDDSFLIIYHNCGNSTPYMLDSIINTGAAGLHFGNAVKMEDILPQIPSHILTMGNIDPAGLFLNGTADSIREATSELLEKCSCHPHFIPSSGCDIPPHAKWENIRAYFAAVKQFYDSV